MELVHSPLRLGSDITGCPKELSNKSGPHLIDHRWSVAENEKPKGTIDNDLPDACHQIKSLRKVQSEPVFSGVTNAVDSAMCNIKTRNDEPLPSGMPETLHPPLLMLADPQLSPSSIPSSLVTGQKPDLHLTSDDSFSSIAGSAEPMAQVSVVNGDGPAGSADDNASNDIVATGTEAKESILLPQRPRAFYCREWVFDKILRHLKVLHQTNALNACLNMDELDTVTETATAISGSTPKHADSGGSSSKPSRKLVLVGGPGSGKTTICRRIVNAQHQVRKIFEAGHTLHSVPLCVQVSAHLLATHFCTVQMQDSLSPATFIRSVRNQILCSPHPLACRFAQLIDSDTSTFGHYLSAEHIRTAPDEAFRCGILDALSAAVTGMTQHHGQEKLPSNELNPDSDPFGSAFYPGVRQVFILVDGVDECASLLAQDHGLSDLQRILANPESDKQRTSHSSGTKSRQSKTILELLANNIQSFPDWLMLFITCRRQNRNVISRTFNGIRRISIDDLHRSAVGHDVQQYLLSRLASEQDLQYAFRAHMHSDFLGLLRIKSSACLLYLETVLDALGELWVKPDQLALIPGTLNGLYLWLCQRLFSSNSTTRHVSCPTYFPLVRPLLEVILAAPQPISEQELYEILSAVDPSFSYEDYCGRLKLLRTVLIQMTVDEERRHFGCTPTNSKIISRSGNHVDRHIHFFHSSFAEWLLDVKHCTVVYLCDIEHGRSLIEHALEGRVYTGRFTHSPTSLPPFDGSNQNDITFANETDTTGGPARQAVTEPVKPSTDPVDSVYTQTNYTSDSLQLLEPGERKPQQASIEPSDSLVLAARKGEFEKIRMLLENKVDVNQLDEDGWSALRTASWRGHMDIVDLLLSYGAEVNLSGPDGRSALRAASWAGHEEIVQRLLDAGADVNQQDAEGRSPLIAAAYMGHVGVVEILAQAGADLNHADEDGRTALHVAAFCVRPSETHHEVVSCLLECGANPNVFDCEGITPLLGAARVGNRTVCELCLEADTDVNQADKYGNTALTLAVLGGHTSVVRLLLFWGAVVDSMDPAGRSLLSLAAAIGSGPIVQELLARGLDEAHRDHAGCTPLHLAAAGPSSASSANCETDATAEQYCEVIRILLESGAHAEDTDNAGRTPLLTACECNHLAAVEVLLTQTPPSSFNCHSPVRSGTPCSLTSGDPPGAAGQHPHGSFGLGGAVVPPHLISPALNRPSLDNQTPLRAAALCNSPDLVRMLLAAGADPDYQDAYGRTTLYLLALEGMLDMADLLLHTPAPGAHLRPGSTGLVGANPVLSDDEGRCPLHVATWQGHLDMVKLLLQAGTPVDIRDREGRTPLQLAAWQGHASICQLLLEEGNARVDAVCSQGATSLCIAAQEGHAHVCSVLLQAGANPFQADSHGRTPYRVALKAGHVEICELLEQRYGSNHPGWFDANGRESLSPELNPHRAGVDQAHGQLGPGIGNRGHSRGVAQDYPHGVAVTLAASNQIQVLPGTPQLIGGGHAYPHQHHHNHVPTRRDYGDDTNPYARPPGPLAVHRFQPPSSDTSSHSETQKVLPSMRFQPGPHVNSSNNPVSFLHPDNFVHSDIMHSSAGQSGPWQYSSTAVYPPGLIQTTDLRPGSFVPITKYSGKPEPPAYDLVHPSAYHFSSELINSQAMHNQSHSVGQHLSPHLTSTHPDSGEVLSARVTGSVHPESRNIPIHALGQDVFTPMESHRSKQQHQQQQQQQNIPHHHHRSHHSKEMSHRAPASHRSARSDGREAGTEPLERLSAPSSKQHNLVDDNARHASNRTHPEPATYPDLLPHQFHQLHSDRSRVEPQTAGAGSAFPPTTVGGTRGVKTANVSSSAPSAVKDRSQTPRYRDELHQPPPLPQHATNPGNTANQCAGTTGTTSASLAAQSETKKQGEERSFAHDVPLHTTPIPAPPHESKASSTKSTLAGMLRFGNRRGKKSRKQPADSPELASQQTVTATTGGCSGGGPLRTKLKSAAQPKGSHTSASGEEFSSERFACVSQPSRAAVDGNAMKLSPTPPPPVGHEFSDRGVTSSMQLEAIARKLACCTQIEGVPHPNPTFVSRSQLASKPYSPQLWDRQSVRNDSNRPPL